MPGEIETSIAEDLPLAACGSGLCGCDTAESQRAAS